MTLTTYHLRSLRCSAFVLPLLAMNACAAQPSPHTPSMAYASSVSAPSTETSPASQAPMADMPSSKASVAPGAMSPSPSPPSAATVAPTTPAAPVAPAKPTTPGGGKPGTTPAAPPESKTNAKTAVVEPGAAVRAMLVFTGQIGLVTEHDQGSATLDKTIDLAEKFGGHVATRNETTVVIKVPSASFRDAMTEVAKLGAVTKQSISTEDVTEEFHDGEVRLQNLKATRQRLQEFLAKATNIADTLTVERELERVSQEIDRIEGRMRFLREKASMSQITLTVTPKAAPQPIAEPPKPEPVVKPNRKLLDLPAGWVKSLGIDGLLRLR